MTMMFFHIDNFFPRRERGGLLSLTPSMATQGNDMEVQQQQQQQLQKYNEMER